LARAALKFAGAFLVAAGVLVGYADGDQFDEEGCTVAHQPGGTSQKGHAGQSTDGADDKAPDSADGSGGGGDGGGPPCEVLAHGHQAEKCTNQLLLERLGDVVAEMAGMRREIAAVAKGNYELRQENEELKQMQGAGLFKFALRVDVADFQAFATVMAMGNRRAAAEFLGVPLATFYRRTDSWRMRGKDYQRMFRLVEWRKATGRKIQVRLEDSLVSGAAGESGENPETIGDVLAKMKERGSDNLGYPEILRQVLEALQEQNEENWDGVRQELVSLLREEV
jgi:hypothetical protein